MVGGGSRQVGIVAAAGIVALESMIERLADDHATAKQLAAGLAELPYVDVGPDKVETNMVFIRLRGLDVQDFCAHMARYGVICRGYGAGMRLVTHYGITSQDIDFVVERARELAPAAVV
jgi:threonine aldolase